MLLMLLRTHRDLPIVYRAVYAVNTITSCTYKHAYTILYYSLIPFQKYTHT